MIQFYVIYLYPFYCYIKKLGVKHLNGIKVSEILSYIEQKNPYSSAKKHVSLNILRIFFMYCINNISFRLITRVL